jgi:DNA-binding IclR family transcriptional regulator
LVNGRIAQARLGASWDEFRAALTAIRRQGYSYTGGELDPPNVGIAAPVFAAMAGVFCAEIDGFRRRSRSRMTPTMRLRAVLGTAPDCRPRPRPTHRVWRRLPNQPLGPGS